MKTKLTILALLFSLSVSAQDYYYQAITMRAAPGKLLELIDLLKDDLRNYPKYGINRPVLMRHSQGDQWDLLLMIPIGEGLDEFFAEDNMKKRSRSNCLNQSYGSEFYEYISFAVEVIVLGPSADDFWQKFLDFDYYHVEMFVALAGKKLELLKQREMENIYLKKIGRDENLIFTKVMGSEVDLFTIGFYRDIKHFAESADITAEDEERAAKKAGFEGVNYIGSYLRELILEHHDTLAGAIRVY